MNTVTLPHPDIINNLIEPNEILEIACKRQRRIAFGRYVQLYTMSYDYERFITYPVIDWKQLALQRKKNIYQSLGHGAFIADIEYFFVHYPEKADIFFQK